MLYSIDLAKVGQLLDEAGYVKGTGWTRVMNGSGQGFWAVDNQDACVKPRPVTATQSDVIGIVRRQRLSADEERVCRPDRATHRPGGRPDER